MALIAHDFSYNQSVDPWHGARNYGPYSADDSRSISDAVIRVCSARDQSVFVPVLLNYGRYNVAVERANLGVLGVNVVQTRVDFSAAGKYTVCQRPVLIPDTMKAAFPHIVFESTRISASGFTTLFWDALRVESLARNDRLETQIPLHAIFLPDVFYFSGRNCFAATAYGGAGETYFNDDQFRMTLSAVLLEAMARPSVMFSHVIPFDGDAVEPRIDRRMYVGVIREVGSVDINLVFFNGNMKQSKMVFYIWVGATRNYITAIPQLPGFNLISRRLTEADKDALMQVPVSAYWTRPANRIEAVGSSIASFAEPSYAFGYNRAAVAAVVDAVQFDAAACSRIQEGLALVCISGGPNGLLVPVQAELPPVGDVVSLVAIKRDIRNVCTVYVELFRHGDDLYGYETILSQDLRTTLQHITFSSGTDIPDEWRQQLLWGPVRSIWVRRVDQVIVADQPLIVTTGATFDYLVTWPTPGAVMIQEGFNRRGIKSLSPSAAERTERVIRAMCADAAIGSTLVPVPENGQNAFVAVVREGGLNMRIGYISGQVHIHHIEPLRSLDLGLPNVAFIPFVYRTYMPITPDTTRTLFEEPIFSYWRSVAEYNPHNWGPRAAAFGLAMHSRVGANSPMRVLDAELIATVARLCLQ